MAHKIKFKTGELIVFNGMTGRIDKGATTDEDWVWIRMPVPARMVKKGF